MYYSVGMQVVDGLQDLAEVVLHDFGFFGGEFHVFGDGFQKLEDGAVGTHFHDMKDVVLQDDQLFETDYTGVFEFLEDETLEDSLVLFLDFAQFFSV